jgi:hypothetical protein
MSSLDDDDLRELAQLLLLSQKVKVREALCLRIGINPSELTFIREGAERDFVIQLINYLNQINDEEALCRLCCQELSLTFHRGKYASVLKTILVKLNCPQFKINPPTNHLENITSLKDRLFKNKKNILIIFALILSAISSYFLLRLLNVSSASPSVRVPASSDPWLAGMPPKSQANSCLIPNNPRYISQSPDNSPTEVTFEKMSLKPGSYLTFTTKGTVSTRADQGFFYGAEGSKLKENETPAGNRNNGISNIVAPNGALVGVFIGEEPPNKSKAPDALSFKKVKERNYPELFPELKQVFFIGDGKTDMGRKQKVIVPIGAKHLYLGIMDYCNWDDNQGDFDVKVTSSK